MKKGLILLFALAVIGVPWSHAQDESGRSDERRAEPVPLGVHWAREFAHSAGFSKRSPNMTWHNGAILPSTATAAIFWGTSWSNSSFVGDKISGIDSWYTGLSIGLTGYGLTADEYNGTNGYVTDSMVYGGHYVDTTPAPSKAPSTSTILNEVCRVIPAPVSNGYYAVYVDTPRGSAGYCAWHSYAACGTVPVQFAFFFNLDGDAGCDPQDTSGLHSQGLAALANVSGHELSEARTDPRNSGWYDSSGQENGDKCAWTFGTPLLTFADGNQWKIQGNWSNYAYNNGTGYPNSHGQKGCVDGGNYPGPATQ